MEQHIEYQSISLTKVAAVSIIAIFALSVMFSIPLISQAACSCTLSLTPVKGAVGRSVTATGTGFPASTSIQILFDGKQVATATTSTSGGFSKSFTVPAESAGQNTVTATDTPNHIDTVSKFFTIVPKITLQPVKGKVGATVSISGTGFAASSAVKVTFAGAQVATGTSSSNGVFSLSFQVPEDAGGKYVVTASDGTNSASKDFTIAPHISLSPVKGPVGTTVSVTGTGFASSSAVTITFNGVKVTSTTTDTNGVFFVTFQVPNIPAATYTVTATSTTSASAKFTIS